MKVFKAILLASAIVVTAACGRELHAADVFPPEPYQAEVQQFSWTGFYAGGAGGWTVDGNADYQIPQADNLALDHELGGPLLGGQLGYLQQIGWLGFGAELQGLWSGVEGEEILFDGAVDTVTDIEALALGKLKAGAAFDRFFIFGTGGYAGAQMTARAHAPLPIGADWQDSTWAHGYFYGVGGAIALTERWSLGVEWNHIVLNDVNFDGPVKGGRYDGTPLSVHGDANLDVILATANFRF